MSFETGSPHGPVTVLTIDRHEQCRRDTTKVPISNFLY